MPLALDTPQMSLILKEYEFWRLMRLLKTNRLVPAESTCLASFPCPTKNMKLPKETKPNNIRIWSLYYNNQGFSNNILCVDNKITNIKLSKNTLAYLLLFLTEPLTTVCEILGLQGTPVKKYCHKRLRYFVLNSYIFLLQDELLNESDTQWDSNSLLQVC